MDAAKGPVYANERACATSDAVKVRDYRAHQNAIKLNIMDKKKKINLTGAGSRKFRARCSGNEQMFAPSSLRNVWQTVYRTDTISPAQRATMLQITEHIETIMNGSKIELYRNSFGIQRKSCLSYSSATAVKNEVLSANSNYPRERT